MVALGVTAYGVGSMLKNGQLEKVPQIFGMPRTVTLAVAAKLLAYNSGGRVKQAANGASAAAAAIALFQFGHGDSVAGYVSGNERGQDRALKSEQAIAKRLADRVSEHLEAAEIAEQLAAE